MEHTKTYMDYKKKANEKFVRYDEGAEMYHMGISKFMQIAKDAKACYKIGQTVLVKLEIIDEYLETFHIVDDDFYKQVVGMVGMMTIIALYEVCNKPLFRFENNEIFDDEILLKRQRKNHGDVFKKIIKIVFGWG